MTSPPDQPPSRTNWAGMALVSPALLVIAIFFVFPLLASVVSAFQAKTGEWTLANFDKSFELYSGDVGYTVVIVAISTAVVGLLSVAIGGYLTLGTNPRAQAVLRWLYRWPLFIPFIVAGQVMRTFLAKNGLLNQLLIGSGILEPLAAQSYLDWRGIVLAFVWKQTPFVALMVAGAMAAIDPAHIEAARNLGAGRLRILFGIIIPQIRRTLMVGLVLSYVTMLSVLSVPLMINPNSPTMMTVDVAYRINAHGDYGVANALCLISLVLASVGAWFYLRHGVARKGVQ
ncbi:MAG: ABC transporter permease subunit [Betaproteobacteria bacterium]|nr:ABC transporter permease subunit [Betaproteobacteria bacterium]